MYQFQDSLPKLPLPRLEDTLERYLEIVAPLLSETELAQTKAAAINFQEGSGPVLQKQLEMIDGSTSTSYLHEFTLNSRLENRLFIPFIKAMQSGAMRFCGKNPMFSTFEPESHFL